jgi:D-beta-D-heptose 7-phosphate kinase/D-beta-D-heptose 1-phosphate adenosyltransferase
VGDVILDRYVFGAVARISPEAPVPVVKIDASEERAGGAANVAVNIRALGIETQLLGLVGADEAAEALAGYIRQAGVQCRFQTIPNYPTVTKTRVVSQHQQLLRLDHESASAAIDAPALRRDFGEALRMADCVVMSDYAKGCLQQAPDLIAAAVSASVPVFVDPKGSDFSRYRGATVLTPNSKEFEAVAGTCRTDRDIEQAGFRMCGDLGLSALLVTRGEHGATLVDAEQGKCTHLPAKVHEVFDVTGAGDTFIAALAAARVSGYGMTEAAAIAVAAAGITVEKLGTATVTAAELNSRLNPGFSIPKGIVSRANLIAAVEHARNQGKRIVMTNGCFDLLHAGHVQYLQQARALGDCLVVAINDDDSVRRLKGSGRPINPVQRRMEVIAALSAVDWVTAFSDDTPSELVEQVSPDLLVKGGDYEPDQIAGAGYVRGSGGEVTVLPVEPGCSTSAIIDIIRRG